MEIDRAIAEAPSAARQFSWLLSNLPVTGALAGGGTIEDLLSITNLALQNCHLAASGKSLQWSCPSSCT